MTREYIYNFTKNLKKYSPILIIPPQLIDNTDRWLTAPKMEKKESSTSVFRMEKSDTVGEFLVFLTKIF